MADVSTLYKNMPARDNRVLAGAWDLVLANCSDSVTLTGGIAKGFVQLSTGSLSFVTAGGTTITSSNFAIGVYHPQWIKQVMATGTDANVQAAIYVCY